MLRRVTLSMLIAASFPAVAAAETPVEDRTAARAFADAALRAAPEIVAASSSSKAWAPRPDATSACRGAVARPCRS